MRQIWVLIAIGLVVLLAGCDAVRSAPDDVPAERPELSPEELVAEHLAAIEELRQRQIPDELQVMPGDPSTVERASVPETVRQEWAIFEEFLFAGADLDLAIDDGKWLDIAVVDDESGQLIFDGEEVSEEDLLFAVSMAANTSLEEKLLGALPEAETVDEWLSRQIIARTGPAFVSSMAQAAHFDVPLESAHFAERPELMVHIPGVGDSLTPMSREDDLAAELEPSEGTEFFDDALQKLVLRKALSAGATLYRAGEWPGVEWGRSEPPQMTQYLVHPRRWFDGDGTATWEWPEAFEQERNEQGYEQIADGEVGPALTAIWLEGLVGARAARTIFSGWRADSYRVYSRGEGEDEERAFHWLTAWETPHDAQEIGAAAEAVLGHYIGHDHRERRFRVAVQGLNVAVSIYDSDRETDELNREVELLTEARIGYLPDDGSPFSFVPTLYDRYVAKADGSTLDLDSEEWIDAASGWRTALDSLEGWTVQRANEAHVRWFANHADGTLIQWTTELVDPLEPEFGSDAYMENLSTAFAQSVSAQEEPDIAVVDGPVEPTIEMEVMGLIDGRPLVLHLWQWRRGDVLVSFSVQGPEAFIGDRLSEAEAILSNLEPHGEAIERTESVPEADPGEDEGIIEFRVDDE